MKRQTKQKLMKKQGKSIEITFSKVLGFCML